MPPIVFALIQGLFLLLLYLFVARAVRWVWRDINAAPRQAAAPAARPRSKSAPAAKRKSRVVPRELVIHTPQAKPRVVRLDAHDITFGRAETSTVALDDPYISDHHARVFLQNGEWCVSDLGSTNGTFVNQVKVTSPTPIAAGDQLGIGKTTVEVRK
ncbi:MAG: FHA domain-containing protein [Nitriliruptorales bacterium]|nr:FHA domain-containing protein [Nitriliruptorales bacterium]